MKAKNPTRGQMTKAKALNLLVQLAPHHIAANARPGPRCILATRVGLKALAMLDIKALPMSVHTIVHNHTMIQFLRQVDRDKLVPTAADWAQLKADGGWTVDMGDIDAPGDGWPGHVVIHVPDQEVLIDLDLQAMHRPLKGIKLPPAAAFPWRRGTTVQEFPGPNGCWVGIREEPLNQGYRHAKDWTINDTDHIAQDIVLAIRRGR